MEKLDSQGEKIEKLISIQKYFGLKQKDFADKIGLTQSKVSLIINGKAGANILNEIFYRLHYEFGISKDWWEKGQGSMFVETVEKKIYPETAQEEVVGYNESYWRGRYDQLKEDHERLLKELDDIKRNNDASASKNAGRMA
ncbi:helix-turn-helix domain-containing protein [Sphingobacterium thalpophilum]|uniref:helix-turn-helix domain-containing protein n=1 Tax=Sphingobacterium thalpophilum TaxID=259 RepID=UPI0024A68E9F|nr:helix-turn-helix transcriptional regulator [Sphingobacterium thalpophilum]